MNPDDLSWAFLFLIVVGLVIAIGVVVGMIAAGRIDRLMTPAPKRRADDPPPGSPPSTPTSSQEDQP